MRQEVTRMHKGWALDNVTLHNDVLRYTPEEIKTPPNVCNCYLRCKIFKVCKKL
jgi:hypothetical protein